MSERPSSVLFACDHNAVRSPMAEAITKYFYGREIYVDSVGIQSMDVDGFAVAAVAEIGIDLARHSVKTFDILHDTSFDLIIALSDAAYTQAMELARTRDMAVEYWPTYDPTKATGNREMRLGEYRKTRDELLQRIKQRFAPPD